MADSEKDRLAVIRFFDETLTSRPNDKRKGRIVVIQQRTHQADLSGHLLAKQGWAHLKLPAIARATTTITFPRSGRIVTRNVDEPLWPEREGLAELAQLREDLGIYAFESQYQQEPVSREGAIFKEAWLRRYYGRPSPSRFDRIIMALDTAFSDKNSADYSAAVVIGHLQKRGADELEPGYHLLHVWRDRVIFPELKKKAVELWHEWNPTECVIEKAASGPSLAQDLQHDTDIIVHEASAHSESKKQRAHSVTGVFEAGKFFIPDDAPWVADFVAELTAFPGGQYNDMVDAMVHALRRLLLSRTLKQCRTRTYVPISARQHTPSRDNQRRPPFVDQNAVPNAVGSPDRCRKSAME